MRTCRTIGVRRCVDARRVMRRAGRVRGARGRGMQHRSRIAVNGRIHATCGTHPRMVSTGHTRRGRHTTHVRRVMPAAMIPRSRVPVRHDARCRNGSQTEDGHTGRSVAVHRSPVVVAIDGEPIRIVTGVGPRSSYAAVRGVVGSAHRPVPVIARGQHHGGEPQKSGSNVSCFHICFALLW